MKKATVLATTFLIVFGMTMGIVLSLNEDANAIWQCSWDCTFRISFTTQTGPFCPGPCPSSFIYYVTRTSTCAGGPLNCPRIVNEVIGCWNGGPYEIMCPFLPE